jgi:hypothetical protein
VEKKCLAALARSVDLCFSGRDYTITRECDGIDVWEGDTETGRGTDELTNWGTGRSVERGKAKNVLACHRGRADGVKQRAPSRSRLHRGRKEVTDFSDLIVRSENTEGRQLASHRLDSTCIASHSLAQPRQRCQKNWKVCVRFDLKFVSFLCFSSICPSRRSSRSGRRPLVSERADHRV